MNSANANIVRHFRSAENYALLCRALNCRVDPAFVESFVRRVEADLGWSDPMPGVSVADEVKALDIEFIRSYQSTTNSYGIVGRVATTNSYGIVGRVATTEADTDDITAEYVVGDGYATTRESRQVLRPDDLLNSWRRPGSTIALREDSAADGRSAGDMQSGGRTTGIVFNDVRHVGMNQHMDQLFDRRFHQLNRDGFGGGFGTDRNECKISGSGSSMAASSMDTLGGREWQRRGIQRRHIERDIDEGLRGGGRNDQVGLVYGHDMSDLRQRITERGLSDCTRI